MFPREFFHYCPRCGAKQAAPPADNSLQCAACGFLYFFNPAIAVAGFVSGPDGLVLFIRRAKEPAKGKLALPGGFVDSGETAEAALRRETREEVNLEPTDLSFLCSQTNRYHYGDVTYPVLDLFFVAGAERTDSVAALDGVASFQWMAPRSVALDEVAFPSISKALVLLRERRPIAPRQPRSGG